jgi:hypothetical protein
MHERRDVGETAGRMEEKKRRMYGGREEKRRGKRLGWGEWGEGGFGDRKQGTASASMPWTTFQPT